MAASETGATVDSVSIPASEPERGARSSETTPNVVLARAEEGAADQRQGTALILAKPPSGTAETVVWIVGTPLAVAFDLGNAKLAVAKGATEFMFADGAVLKVVGLEVGTGGLPDTAVTLADGSVVGVNDLASLAEITPSSGETLSASPAAGDTPPGNQGHATVPSDIIDLGEGLSDTGALLYTDLTFSLTDVQGDVVENILQAGAPALAVSINDVVASEGNPFIVEGGFGDDADGEGDFELVDDETTFITFAVTLNAAASEAVTVNYSVVPGSAVLGDANLHEGDYTPLDPLAGTITFAPGETVKTITLNVLDDFQPEDIENFTVVLSDVSGAALADGIGVGTILDDDPEAEGDEVSFLLSSFAGADDATGGNTLPPPAPGGGTGDLVPQVVLNE